MLKIKNLLLIGIFSVLLFGCSKANTSETPITSNSYVPINQSSYPSPIEQPTVPPINTAYPSPIDLGGAPTAASTQVYFVTGLVVPTPNSGKAVVTGKLLGSGNGTEPFITSIYLATVEPATTAGATPEVKYSEQTDPIATQDLTTGQFMLPNVTPGQYALVIWTQNGGTPLKDGSGNPIIFNVNSGETRDLGDIHVP